jgi:hypothetical protein
VTLGARRELEAHAARTHDLEVIQVVGGHALLGSCVDTRAPSWTKFLFATAKRNEPFGVLATLMVRELSFLVNRPVRDPMIAVIPMEVVWLSTGFIMLMAAFLAGAAE